MSLGVKNRIEFIDGLRGLAILLVILFHAYARWPEIVPYRNQFANFPIFKFGWLGVELFFLVSGFVILMTLEKCDSVSEFLFRRWLRLFPAMLISTAIIYVSATLFYERPAGSPYLEEVLPGLTFIEPTWWARVLGHSVKPIEGSFWSIFVEFKFYVFAAIVYYWRGRKALFVALCGAYFLTVSAIFGNAEVGIKQLEFMAKIASSMSLQYFGWFASGAAFFIYIKTSEVRWFRRAMVMAVASAITTSGLKWQDVVATTSAAAIFGAALASARFQKMLTFPIFQFFGSISYPLYLIHQNIMISLIVKLGKNFGLIPLLFLPVLPIAFLSGVAFLIAKYGEPYVKFKITSFLSFSKSAKICFRRR